MIIREEYLQKLIDFKDKHLIKVATGIRRCGKSTLFMLFRDYLLKNGITQSQIQNINMEDIANENLLEYHNLHNHILQNLAPNLKNYIFIDEIQQVKNFEKALDSLFIRENLDIYVTGSNALMLSSELATLLSGRYVEIQMFPFSFKEYFSAFKGENSNMKFSEYIEQGSFPQLLVFNGEKKLIDDYLTGIYNTVIVKDILSRYKIKEISRLEAVVKFLFSNIGSETSLNNIANVMKNDGITIQRPIIEEYIEALTASYIFYKAVRFDIKGKQILKTNAKYYSVDTGLRYMILGINNPDTGHIIENIVYLELRRRGYKVYVGKIGNSEVDFVAVKGGETEYYQVSLSIMAQSTLERELLPLKSISDHNPKYIITMDYLPKAAYDGIKTVNLIEWLLS